MSEELDWFDGELKLCECEDVSWQSPVFSNYYLQNIHHKSLQRNDTHIDSKNNYQQQSKKSVYNNGSNSTIHSHNNKNYFPLNNISGTLILTNFRLRFIPQNWGMDDSDSQISTDNLLLKKYDVVLYNIETINKVKKKKRKNLRNGSLLKKKVSVLEIVCKTFQVVTLVFEAVHNDDLELKMVYTLLEAVKDANLHPFLSYAGQDDNEDDENVGYGDFFKDDAQNTEAYWQSLLDKCVDANNHRVISCNEAFHVTDSLPKFFVVASSLSARDVIEMSPKFVHNRFPFWCFTHAATQTSLTRMAFKVASVQEDVEDKIFKSIQQSHPAKKLPHIYNLNNIFPSNNDINHAFLALKTLCTYDATVDAPSDNKFLSQMESSNWLSLVSTCLKTAQDIATCMSYHQLSVVVKELNSSVLSPLISCLVQLMLDPTTRHRPEFEDLVAREWLWLSARFAYKHQSATFSPPCNSLSQVDAFQFPVFLLFLDCVYQFTMMTPSNFSFNSTYLQSLWTSVCCGLYKDLLFNSPKEIYYNKVNKQSVHMVNHCRQAGQQVMGTLMRRSQMDFGTLRRSKKDVTSSALITSSNKSNLDKKHPTKHSLVSLNAPRPVLTTRKQSLMTLSSPDPSFLTEHTKYPQRELFGTQTTHLASKLWCWSFMFERVQLEAFDSIPYLASQCREVDVVKQNEVDNQNHLNYKVSSNDHFSELPSSPKAHKKPPLSPKHHQKPPLSPKGYKPPQSPKDQEISSASPKEQRKYKLSPKEHKRTSLSSNSPLNGFKLYKNYPLNQSIPFQFFHLNFSQPFLTFWADCYLKHNSFYHYNHHIYTNQPSSSPTSDTSDEYHVIKALRTRIFLLQNALETKQHF